MQHRVSRNAAPTVATHTPKAAVRIKVHHSVVGLTAFLQKQQSVCAYPPPTIAQDPGCLWTVSHLLGSVIDDNKIVASTGHFRESDHHFPEQIYESIGSSKLAEK
jgi:hypothetical protein